MLAVAVGMAIVFGMFPYNHFGDHDVMPLWLSAFYGTFSRPAWALAVAWVLIACRYDCGGNSQI